MIKTLYKVFIRLRSKRRKQLFLLLLNMVISGFLETLTLAAIVPFLSALTEPYKLLNNQIYKSFANFFSISSTRDIIFSTIFIFSFFALFSGIFRIFNEWYKGKVTSEIGSELSSQAFYNTLYQPYSFYINNNSSETIAILNKDVNNFLLTLNQFLNFLNASITFLSILIALLIFNWKITISIVLIFLSFYLIVNIKTKPILNSNSEKQRYLNIEKISIIQDSLGSIRDVIVNEFQDFYISRYQKAEVKLRRMYAKNQLFANSPKYILDSLGLILISTLAGVTFFLRGNISEVLPILGVFGLGSQKMLPIIQNIYLSFSVFNANKNPIEKFIVLLDKKIIKRNNFSKLDMFNLLNSISFKKVSFQYNKDNSYVLKEISLKIKKGDKVGLIGKTGSGKSTLLDLLIGLTSPTSGTILIDNKDLHNLKNIDLKRKWKNSISHVPQSIYLINSSIYRNIAFGIKEEDINYEKVKRVAKIALVTEFTKKFKNGLHSNTGERGVKLSGGQRQRIGIARALYNLNENSNLLIFDEATSALDFKTEEEIIKSIESNYKSLTMIFITHRLKTLKNFDKIFSIGDGILNQLEI